MVWLYEADLLLNCTFTAEFAVIHSEKEQEKAANRVDKQCSVSSVDG